MTKKRGDLGTEDTSLLSAYFLSLTVANIRCFSVKTQSLDLSSGDSKPAEWTVLLGENGTGKTTLLHTIATCIDCLNYYSEGNEHDPTRSFRYTAELRRGIIRQTSIDFQATFCVSSRLGEGGVSATLTSDIDSGTQAVQLEAPDITLQRLLFVAYGASRRMSRRAVSESRSEDPCITLFDPNAELLNAEEWLVLSDYATKIGDVAQKQRAINRYQKIKRCLIGDGLGTGLLPDVEDFRFTTTDDGAMTPRVEAKTPYGWVRVRDLSLGYQAALSWMIDFASRMFERYPNSENPLAEPAICLVDEIDLHLHPRWQRELVRVLTETFPNTQFIVTAHSPLIVQAAPNANLALLRREGDHVVIENDVDEIRNWSVGQILTSELFGLPSERPPQFEAKLNERARLVGKKKLTAKERTRLAELDAELETMPLGENPAQIRALEFLERMASRRGQGK